MLSTMEFSAKVLRAAQYANNSVLKSLLNKMKLEDFLNCCDKSGRTILHLVCDAGIPEDGRDCYFTIINWMLRMASQIPNGREEIYTYLNKQDKIGETALHISIKNSCREISDDLILKGADVTMKSHKGKSQMDLLGIYYAKSLANDMDKNISYIRKSRYCNACQFTDAAKKNGDIQMPDDEILEDNLLSNFTFCLHFGTFIPYASSHQFEMEEDVLEMDRPASKAGNSVFYEDRQSQENDLEGSLKDENPVSPVDGPNSLPKKSRRPRRKLNRMTVVHPIEFPPQNDVSAEEARQLKPKDDHNLKKRNEMEMVYNYSIADDSLRDAVLLHPLLTAFLHLKWRILQRYILATMLYYLFWVVLYFAFTIGIFRLHFPTLEIKKGSIAANLTDSEMASFENTRITGLEILKALRLLISTFPILFEAVQMFSLRWYYITGSKNWAQLFLIFLSIFEYFNIHIPRIYNAFAILCCIFLILSQVDEFPNIIKDNYEMPSFMKRMLTWVTIRYFEIFRNLMKKISWLLIPFGLVILGFQIAFSILFRQIENFQISLKSFVRLLALTVGHISFHDVFSKEYSESAKPYHESLALCVYAIFLIIVIFVWSNFLIGITLEDFQKERLNAEKNSITSRIEMMYVMEKLLHSIPILLPFLRKKPFYKKTSVLRKYGKHLECHVHIHKNDFPRDLVEELREVIKNRKMKPIVK